MMDPRHHHPPHYHGQPHHLHPNRPPLVRYPSPSPLGWDQHHPHPHDHGFSGAVEDVVDIVKHETSRKARNRRKYRGGSPPEFFSSPVPPRRHQIYDGGHLSPEWGPRTGSGFLPPRFNNDTRPHYELLKNVPNSFDTTPSPPFIHHGQRPPVGYPPRIRGRGGMGMSPIRRIHDGGGSAGPNLEVMNGFLPPRYCGMFFIHG